MKIKVYAFLLSIFAQWQITFGHEVIVHETITENAAASAFDGSSIYRDFLNTISPDFSLADVTNYLIQGSAHEDDPVNTDSLADGIGGGWRSLNHFYDPLDHHYGKGLSDFPPDIRALEGTNSFAWASISNCAGVPYDGLHPINVWSWQNARAYEWLGLTATNQSDRFDRLTDTFRAIGQVMHLLQDTSQPQHVRNEQHLDKFPHTSIKTPWISPIEKYGKENSAVLNYQHAMLDWRGSEFAKLEDFWDRHLYAPGNPTVLQAAENGGHNSAWRNGATAIFLEHGICFLNIPNPDILITTPILRAITARIIQMCKLNQRNMFTV